MEVLAELSLVANPRTVATTTGVAQGLTGIFGLCRKIPNSWDNESQFAQSQSKNGCSSLKLTRGFVL